MIDTQSSEAYSKTGAFNFLKTLLGISKKATININFFRLFFEESEGFWFIKKSEDIVKNIFTNEGIRELNKMYFEKKLENKPDEANEIAQRVLRIVRDSLAA